MQRLGSQTAANPAKGWFPKGGFGGCSPVPKLVVFLLKFLVLLRLGSLARSLSMGGRNPNQVFFPELRLAVYRGSAVVGCGHSLECRGGWGCFRRSG